jgi:hypothetical protein
MPKLGSPEVGLPGKEEEVSTAASELAEVPPFPYLLSEHGPEGPGRPYQAFIVLLRPLERLLEAAFSPQKKATRRSRAEEWLPS